MKTKKHTPLATVGSGSKKLEIHRGEFHAFQSTKYLDVSALKKVKKATLEIGRVKAAGWEITLAAEVREGSITKLKPLDCRGCDQATRSARKSGASGRGPAKKLVREALARIHELGLPITKLPIRLGSAGRINIPIDPIIIFTHDFDICITVTWPDGTICLYCLFKGPGDICLGDTWIEH